MDLNKFFTNNMNVQANTAWINAAVKRYRNSLQSRIDFLMPYLDICDGRTLKIATRKTGGHYYYERKNDGTTKYITSENGKAINELAKKYYAQKVVASLKKNLISCDKFLSAQSDYEERAFLESLPDDFLEYIEDISVSNEKIKKLWEEQPYSDYNTSHAEDLKIDTISGVTVRSKSEAIIADVLYNFNIPYLYEFPLFCESCGTNIFPDFSILNLKTHQIVYWEHCGRMDYPRYVENFVKKIDDYASMGMYPGKNLILTFETETQVMTSKKAAEIIRQYIL